MAYPPDRHERDATRHLGVTRSAADLVPELQRRIEQLEQALGLLIHKGKNFYAFIEGECSSLLEDDHNGDFDVDLANAEKSLDAARKEE